MAYKIVQLTLEMPVGEGKEKIHPTLIIEEEETILVDCGFTGALPQLQQELKRHGIDEQKLTAVVLTHHDHDHMGTAALLKQTNPNIKIYATAKEEPSISAKEKPLRLQQAEEMQKYLLPQKQAFGKAFCAMLRRVEPVEVDVLLQEGGLLKLVRWLPRVAYTGAFVFVDGKRKPCNCRGCHGGRKRQTGSCKPPVCTGFAGSEKFA